jgi:hypothetical protein
MNISEMNIGVHQILICLLQTTLENLCKLNVLCRAQYFTLKNMAANIAAPKAKGLAKARRVDPVEVDEEQVIPAGAMGSDLAFSISAFNKASVQQP